MDKSYTAIIERDEDGMYIGRVPSLRGCVTQAKTMDELIIRLKDAVKLFLEVQGEDDQTQFVGTQQIIIAQ